MADAEEILRLPKPIQISNCDMRPELVNFSGERRWDLLGFVRPDEVEEVKACNVDESGNRYYLVHWRDSWKPESSLIYCEKLLQQFWAQKSLLQQDEQAAVGIANDSDDKINNSENRAELPHGINDQVPINAVLSSENTSNVEFSLPDTQQHQQAFQTTADTTNLIQSESKHALYNTDTDVDLTIIRQNIVENIPIVAKSNSPNSLTQNDNQQQQQEQLQHFEQGKQLEQQQQQQHQEPHQHQLQHQQQQQQKIDNIVILKIEAIQETSKKDIEDNIELTDDSAMAMDSLSKKGASKRKNRLPRQSVQSSSSVLKAKKQKVKKNKERIKKKLNSKGKIAKMVATVITGDTLLSASSISNTDNPQKKIRDDTEGEDNNIDTNSSSNSSENNVNPNTSTGNLKCMVCNKSLNTQQNLMKHLLTHNNNHTCTICMKTFKSTHFLKHHMDKHNASYEYACPVCDKKFKFKNNMRGHLRKHNMEKKFECEVCNKKFIGRYNLKEHMKSHSDERPFECDFCRKTYKDRGALNKHLLTHQDKKVECELCKRPFTNGAQLKRHMQFHFSWPGDSYKRKSVVGADGEKVKHTCEYCGKMFNHYSNMNAHIHKKHKEKKIECAECSKMFAYQYELREHMFIHSGGQEASKFKCQYCEKSFQRSTTLKNHERTTHLGIKRFKCDICGKMFGTKFNMKVHVEKLHPNGELETESTTAAANRRHQPRITPRSSDKLRVNELTGLPNNPVQDGTVNFVNPEVHHQNAVASMTQVSLANAQHSLLRNMSTSDIIRNAMSNMPDLGYFPGLQSQAARAYQFYGIPPPDFGVPN